MLLPLLAAAAAVNKYLAGIANQNAALDHFVSSSGIQLHYSDQGESPDVVVLLHGAGSVLQDFELCGLTNAILAQNYRVIAFDRPGFGLSERTRGKDWTPQAQASAIQGVLDSIGISRAIIVGHSWGALVAIALALKNADFAQGLVLISGYYFPSFRPAILMASLPALPGIGDVLTHTVQPLISRAMWGLVSKKLFAPNPVPSQFSSFPKDLALRPSQLRAGAEDSALLIPAVERLESLYPTLNLPVSIFSGTDDRVVESSQSERLHQAVKGSTLHMLPNTGHMVHYIVPQDIAAAVAAINSRP